MSRAGVFRRALVAAASAFAFASIAGTSVLAQEAAPEAAGALANAYLGAAIGLGMIVIGAGLGIGKFAAAAAGYQSLRDANLSDPSVAEARLNALGYALLTRNEFKGAIAVLRLNTQLYPDSANTYDSLAEAHMKAGDRKQAIALYRKALETLPRDKSPEAVKDGVRASSTAKLKELEAEKP